MDLDRDGKVSFDDFRFFHYFKIMIITNYWNSNRTTVIQEPLMMEAFGECLPYNKAGFRFMHDFLDSMPGNRIYCV